jgi:uncharacterized RDD family membrane protein YckC
LSSAPAASAPPSAPPDLAPLSRRLVALVYEAILLVALLWCAALAYDIVEGLVTARHARLAFQLYLLGVCGVYFVWQWTHGGQTLPMKTWRLRLVTLDGATVGARRAWARYALAAVSLLGLGLGFTWALVDPDRQFLHDRIARTRIVKAPPDRT